MCGGDRRASRARVSGAASTAWAAPCPRTQITGARITDCPSDIRDTGDLMNKGLIAMIGGWTSLIATEAAAAPPAWCKGAPVEATDLRGLSSSDARDVVKALVA